MQPDELQKILGLIPGSVSPFGLLNDEERKVVFCIDRTLTEGRGLVGVHPNDNTATVWLRTEDLVRIIQEHGNAVQAITV